MNTPHTERKRKSYDHRLRQYVGKTGDIRAALDVGPDFIKKSSFFRVRAAAAYRAQLNLHSR